MPNGAPCDKEKAQRVTNASTDNLSPNDSLHVSALKTEESVRGAHQASLNLLTNWLQKLFAQEAEGIFKGKDESMCYISVNLSGHISECKVVINRRLDRVVGPSSSSSEQCGLGPGAGTGIIWDT